MSAHDAGEIRFKESWPLHLLRYALVLTGVSAWLFEAIGEPGVPLAALGLSLVLHGELPLHGPSPARHGSWWAAIQLATCLGVHWSFPGLGTGLVLCATLSGVALTFPVAWTGGALAAAGAVTLAATFASQTADTGTGLGLVAAYALSVWLGRMFSRRIEERRAFKETVAQLEEAQQRLARLAENTRVLAAARERQRLSEQIHDTLGHALTGTLLQTQIARRLIEKDPAAAAERLELIERSVRETLDSVRKSLRLAGRQDREQLPLHLAIESLAADFELAGGPKVELVFRPDAKSVSDVSPEVAEMVYRTVQEAMTNAVRHGKADRIRIETVATDRRLSLRIEDNGLGSAAYTPGLGLTGMVSRVQALGGTLRFQTAPGEGFQVEVRVKRW